MTDPASPQTSPIADAIQARADDALDAAAWRRTTQVRADNERDAACWRETPAPLRLLALTMSALKRAQARGAAPEEVATLRAAVARHALIVTESAMLVFRQASTDGPLAVAASTDWLTD